MRGSVQFKCLKAKYYARVLLRISYHKKESSNVKVC